MILAWTMLRAPAEHWIPAAAIIAILFLTVGHLTGGLIARWRRWPR